MCGRFGVTDVQYFGDRFQTYLNVDLSEARPRYKAAPTQRLLAINAWAEGIQYMPTFRTPFKRQCCLVSANHFLEWQVIGKKKQPYLIRLTDSAALHFRRSLPRSPRSGRPRSVYLLDHHDRDKRTDGADSQPDAGDLAT